MVFEIARRAKAVCALSDGDGTLGVGAQSNAWDVQIGGFLLQTSRIRYCQGAVKYQIHERNVAKRFRQQESSRVLRIDH